ncbi:GtrA family protein [Luteimonas salinilitoris]|uniref:GtrA family protein n=1 Tax=Luteimonas salinilitoris TaxID=3237697 RepID=A0ABV4HTU6_9GAMM
MQLKLIQFALVGVLNTAVGLSIIVGSIAAGLHPLVANAAGYLVGFCVSFVANSRFTFRKDPRSIRRLLRYLLAFLVSYAGNLLAVLALDSAFPEYTMLTHVAGIVPYTIVFFILADRFVFNDDPAPANQAPHE